ncbi:hypothetical protein BT69DRAFT_1358318 [Atractiella rhizophila]|nr:hypothetical protein BT69DRAFT_1358744 [Atractiella rhizophila]KAH8914196.1 hypothetical protein BT69DRAFT_1358318 [Atractiella rhizophila]
MADNPGKLLELEEVAKHASKESCWVVLHGKVYDVTEFLPEHPGGQAIILKYAGKDATEPFDPIHPPDTLDKFLPKEKHLGPLSKTSLEVLRKTPKEVSSDEKEREERKKNLPPLELCLNLYDFENLAKTVMAPAAWAYYSSGSDDEITMRENHSAYQRLWFRPRILRDVTNVDFSTTLLGCKSSMPMYITATALGKLGHPEGEKNLTRAAHTHGVIQMIPTLASCSFDEIVDTAQPGQNQWFQLYVNKDRSVTERIVRHAEKRGIKGLFITVDAPQLGRRAKDMRMKFEDVGSQVQQGDSSVDRSQGAARAISSFIDPGLSWKDMKWFKSITKMPLILKGVQCWEDAVLAAEMGLQGVVLSNHGGRQLDFARSGIEILVEVKRELKRRGLDKPDFEIYVDGGVRRAGDILKAVALGAKAVGIGRPFLYAYSAYGHQGVERAIQILKDEMEMNMRLIGARNIEELVPDMIDTRNIGARSVDSVPDHLYNANYEPLELVKSKL